MRNAHIKYPWRYNNCFSLLINGDIFYSRMLDCITRAKKYIFFETYFVESGVVTTNFLKALVAARKKGIQVFVLFDDLGSRNFSEEDRRYLRNNNISLSFYNPVRFTRFKKSFHRDHRKLLLIDNLTAFVGGAGLSDQFVGADSWRDNMIEINGPVVRDWYSLFHKTWSQSSNELIPDISKSESIASGNALGKLTYTKGSLFNEIRKELLNHIETSAKRVWLTSAYFFPSTSIRRALCRAALRGVDVRILIPGYKTDHPPVRYAGQSFYAKLLRNKIRIFEYQKHFIHSKLILVDSWVSLGSSNMDTWGGYWNLEANQEILDLDFAKKMEQMIQADLNDSIEVFYEEWKKRSLLQKTKEWFWQLMGKIFSRVKDPRIERKNSNEK